MELDSGSDTEEERSNEGIDIEEHLLLGLHAYDRTSDSEHNHPPRKQEATHLLDCKRIDNRENQYGICNRDIGGAIGRILLVSHDPDNVCDEIHKRERKRNHHYQELLIFRDCTCIPEHEGCAV